MNDKFKKANGFPTRYGYACGHGKREVSPCGNYRKSIFEDGSHNCIDVIAITESGRTWEQFFYWDGPGAAKKAEKFYKSVKLQSMV